jgi:hypothetical protein
LQVFSTFIQGQRVVLWCDSRVAVAILHSGRSRDPILHSIARNIYLLQAALDCDVEFSYIPGYLNTVVDLLSHWESTLSPTAALFAFLPTPPVWYSVPSGAMELDQYI